MQIMAVFGVLVLAIALWLFFPRVTMVVLTGLLFQKLYPWLFNSTDSILHLGVNIIATVSIVAGCLAGAAMDLVVIKKALDG